MIIFNVTNSTNDLPLVVNSVARWRFRTSYINFNGMSFMKKTVVSGILAFSCLISQAVFAEDSSTTSSTPASTNIVGNGITASYCLDNPRACANAAVDFLSDAVHDHGYCIDNPSACLNKAE